MPSYWFKLLNLITLFIVTNLSTILNYLGLGARKPVLGVFVKARFKPVISATETIWKIIFSPVAS